MIETVDGVEMVSGEIGGADWREVDRTLQGLAKQRAALDAVEARWLRVAERIQIWRRVGCSSLLEYIERRLGYGPRAAQDRLRVAFALDKLPALALSLETGEMPFTAVRELTRVATPETEQVWLDAGRDKNVHQIEKLVSGHQQGDLPTDAPDPALVKKVLRYEVRPATYALIRQAQRALEKQRGERLDDDQLIAALAGLVLGAAPAVDVDVDAATSDIGDATPRATIATAVGATDPGRARFQIAVVRCEACGRGWTDGGGASMPMDAAELERAECDAQHIGHVDGDAPARATQDIAPRVRRLVHRRDRGHCVVPGCRAAANLELHHIVAREDGGSHEPKNLVLLCDGHHAALHRGTLSIRGEAPDRLLFERRHDAHVDVTRFDRASVRVEVRAALVKLGFKPAEASAAVDAARAKLAGDANLELLLRTALAHCPRKGQVG